MNNYRKSKGYFMCKYKKGQSVIAQIIKRRLTYDIL